MLIAARSTREALWRASSDLFYESTGSVKQHRSKHAKPHDLVGPIGRYVGMPALIAGIDAPPTSDRQRIVAYVPILPACASQKSDGLQVLDIAINHWTSCGSA
jgi:hypothetical protein